MALPLSTLEIICYFDIFNHPLTEEEVGRFIKKSEGQKNVELLINDKKLFRSKKFLSINKDIDNVLRKKKELEMKKSF